MVDAYVADVVRTPVGRYGGCLSSVRPDDLLAFALRSVLNRNPTVTPALVEDVIAGAANQAGEDNRNVARMALLLAGLPVNVGGVTVNRLCASGLQAIIDASNGILSKSGSVYIASGVESMSRAPFVMGKQDKPFSRQVEMFDTTMGWRFINPILAEKYHPFSMGETAENVAERYSVSREDQDLYALSSQERYAGALASGRWKDEMIYVPVPSGKGEELVTADEHPRATSIEKLSALKPVFKKNGTVTAGNASGINDGAAAALIVDKGVAARIKPLARIVSYAVAGVDPAEMGMGPVPAVQKALKRAGLRVQDVDLFELNEAFASQVIACIRELGIDPGRVNVNGGSIAIGHPLGASGVRISATLLHEMKRRRVKIGVATMCVGVGQGVAVVYENCNL